jgi:hypothetical protein
MSNYHDDPKIIDITPNVKKDHRDNLDYDAFKSQQFKVRKKEIELIQINNRLSFIYVMLNLQLAYLFILTLVIFYLSVR